MEFLFICFIDELKIILVLFLKTNYFLNVIILQNKILEKFNLFKPILI